MCQQICETLGNAVENNHNNTDCLSRYCKKRIEAHLALRAADASLGLVAKSHIVAAYRANDACARDCPIRAAVETLVRELSFPQN
jgi:hypothetical protein